MSAEALIIPDTVHGAILLSVIDFFLSFVVISFIGVVLAFFPYLNRFGKTLQATPVAVEVMPRRNVNAERAAVIAAAIYSMTGRRRIVRITPAAPRGWTAPVRTHLHTSHAPRITGR